MSRISHPLIFVRHGETPWNAEGRYQGKTDTLLSPKGAQQAFENARMIEHYLDHIGYKPEQVTLVSSPLQRAQQTADLIAKSNNGFPPVIQNPAFSELSQGRWEGLTSQEVKDRFYEERKSRKKDRWHFKPKGGESMADRHHTIEQVLLALNPATIVVTHSVVLRIIWHILGGLQQEEASKAEIPHVGLLIWDGTKLTYRG